MTTTYSSTSCNSENIIACSQLVSRGCCMHVFLVIIYSMYKPGPQKMIWVLLSFKIQTGYLGHVLLPVMMFGGSLITSELLL